MLYVLSSTLAGMAEQSTQAFRLSRNGLAIRLNSTLYALITPDEYLPLIQELPLLQILLVCHKKIVKEGSGGYEQLYYSPSVKHDSGSCVRKIPRWAVVAVRYTLVELDSLAPGHFEISRRCDVLNYKISFGGRQQIGRVVKIEGLWVLWEGYHFLCA